MAREPELVALYRHSAEAGDATAQFNLGELFRLGSRVPRDLKEAVIWLNRAAAQGHSQAGSSLRQLADQGVDVTPSPQDPAARPQSQSLDQLLDSLRPAVLPEGDRGIDLPLKPPEPDFDPLYDQENEQDVTALTLAAETGDAAAQVALGNACRLGRGVAQDHTQAARWYGLAAQAGDARGQYSLGVMADLGLGMGQSDTEALRWYLAAAQGGDLGAQFNLGNMIRHGRGCAADPAVAAQWYRKAAKGGDAGALFALGTLYETGSGVGQDDLKAADLYRQAAERGDADAQFNLSNMLRQGRGGDLDWAESASYCQRAAEQGLALAQLNFGLMLSAGLGVAQDDAAAVHWFREAAAAGEPRAQYQLARMYENGRGVRKDSKAAAEWCGKAAAAGNPQAQYDMALTHLGQDKAEAARLFRAAAEQGHALACYNLGILSATGQGIAKDEIDAHMWLDMAASSGVAAVVELSRRGMAQLAQRLGPDGVDESARRRTALRRGGAA